MHKTHREISFGGISDNFSVSVLDGVFCVDAT